MTTIINEKETNQIQKVFNYGESKVRTVIIDGEPWFVAKDVCDILEINNPSQAMSRLDSDEKNTIILNEGIGNPEKSTVNESGLYNLILGSRKPEAKQFKRWVTHEVLPSIRKHGLYMTNETAKEAVEDTELFLSRALLIAKEKLDKQEALIKAQETKIEQDAPKVTHYNSYMESNQTHCFADIAAILGIHVTDLTKALVTDEVLMRNIKGELKPRKAYLNKGYFRVKHTDKYIHTRVTPKGTQWLLSRYGN